MRGLSVFTLSVLGLFIGCAKPASAPQQWTLDREFLEIRIPKAASPSEQFAAEELRDYFRKISGVEIPIEVGEPRGRRNAIFVGRHESSRPLWENLDNPDHYIIDSTFDEIRIVGGFRPSVRNSSGTEFVFDWGVLYGVYQFLEDQGVRWFRPEPDGEHVPKGSKLLVKDGRRDFQPAFMLRWGPSLYASKFLKSATEAESHMARLWALRNRANATGFTDPKYGGQINVGGGGHVYSRLVPPELFAKHPEFFPLIDGVRTVKGQICQGNPEVQKYVAQKIISEGLNNPQLFMTSIDPNDGGGWCECDLCRALDDPALMSGRGGGLSMSSRVVAFNNIVAKMVAKECPDLLLYCLAYSQYLEAPTRVTHLEPNLVIGLAPFAGAFSDYSRALRDPGSGPNQKFLKSMEGFQKLGAKMYAREYLSHYAWPGPLPLVWTMQDRFREYQKAGFIGVYSETHPCWGPQGIILYMYLRLLWNPDLDVDTELENYCRDFYGPAAAPMLAYHQALEKRGRNGPYFGSGGSHAQNLFTNEFLSELQPYVEEATKAASGVMPYSWRVECVVAGYEFARLYRQTANFIKAGQLDRAKASLAELDAFYGDRYPKGDVFNKGEARWKDAKGAVREISLLRDLRTQIAKSETVESQFEKGRTVQVLDMGWKFQTDPEESGAAQGWNLPDWDDAGWPRLNAGSPWQHQGFDGFAGTAWYRRAFATPAHEGGQRLVLVFQGVDGDVTVWINGKEVGRRDLINLEGVNQWDDPFFFDVTGALNTEKLNTLSVRVKKTSGNGGIHRSVKLIRTESLPVR